jgi:hypothetical protein
MSGTISGFHSSRVTVSAGGYADPVTNVGVIAVNAIGGAIYAGSVWTVVNQGSISTPATATANGDSGINLGFGGVVTNATGGVITGNTGVLTDGGSVINQAGALIDTYGVAVKAYGQLTLQNAGTLRAHGNYYSGVVANSTAYVTNTGVIASDVRIGLYLRSGGTVTNAASAAIAGKQDAIIATGNPSTIVNAGYLSSGSDAAVYVRAGGLVYNEVGGVIVDGGAHASIGALAAVYGRYEPMTVVNAGTIAGGVATGVILRSILGGSVTNLATGTISSLRIIDGAARIVNAGTLGGVTLAAGFANRLEVEPGAVFSGPVTGGNSAGATATSTLELAAGSGTLAGVGVAIAQFGDISFDSGAAWLVSGSVGGLAGGQAITGFAAGDTLELTGVADSYSAFAGGVLTLSGGTMLDLPGAAHASVGNDGSNTFITACFATGTGIATSRGRVAVEALREGMLVLTGSGRLAAIRWIGRRRTDLRRHPRPYDVMPVRVTAGAFGPSLPSRDVILSPDHAVFVYGVLAPVRHLINGASIVQETRATVTYWHVELDRHDVILAEDLPCESFLDTGNRCAFENAPGAVAMTPDFARAVWDERGCAPILTDPREPRLRALHLRLLALARHPRHRGAEASAAL